MMNLINDFSFWNYGISFLLAFVGFLIFAGWWWRIGRTTEIYVYIMILFLADAIFFGGNVHIRIIKALYNGHEAIAFSDTLIWHLRGILHSLIMFLILARMICRIRRTLRYEKKNKNESPINHRRRECPKCDSPNHAGARLDDNKS